MTQFFAKCCMAVGAIATLFCSLSSTAATDNQTKQVINIGIYAPFTSDSAYIGRHILGAMEIARDQLKSTAINYEFYTLDKLPNSANAANTLQKFIEVHHLNVLLSEGAATGAVVAPLAKKNNLIHFCLGGDDGITDGKNNFQSQSPNHQRGAVLATAAKPEFVAQFKEEYFSHPVTEAGYAYDIFHLLNNSAVLAMKKNEHFSTQAIATNLLALESGKGLLGAYSMNKKGISYKKNTLTA